MASRRTVFAQLTFRASLRDIEACLRDLGDRLYTWGSGVGSSGSPWPKRKRPGTGVSTPTPARRCSPRGGVYAEEDLGLELE